MYREQSFAGATTKYAFKPKAYEREVKEIDNEKQKILEIAK